MGKETKTNAMRILDRRKIPYEVFQYECEDFVDGIHVADQNGVPREQSFKTLVMRGKSGANYVLVIPVELSVDLKAAARVLKEKSIEMIPVKDITAVTGYVRGGCSPIGMKKQYPTVIHETARWFDTIYVSGGRKGTTIAVNPIQLAEACGARFEKVCEENEK